jgi:predicted hotdog family 3-hydroxylacyl-ACP dehydratase
MPDAAVAHGVVLDHAWIAARIPHQGSMCLLDCVLEWNETLIRCRALSHRAADNPLRANGRLAALCGIEYAAQSMAVHGALCAPGSPEIRRPALGYLASVRKLVLEAERLDTIAEPLEIEARRIGAEPANVLYAFVVRAGGRTLLSGRAAVVLDAAPPA